LAALSSPSPLSFDGFFSFFSTLASAVFIFFLDFDDDEVEEDEDEEDDDDDDDGGMCLDSGSSLNMYCSTSIRGMVVVSLSVSQRTTIPAGTCRTILADSHVSEALQKAHTGWFNVRW
jgi:hypothetical protein